MSIDLITIISSVAALIAGLFVSFKMGEDKGKKKEERKTLEKTVDSLSKAKEARDEISDIGDSSLYDHAIDRMHKHKSKQ